MASVLGGFMHLHEIKGFTSRANLSKLEEWERCLRHLPLTPLEAHADLDFNLDCLSLPAEPECPSYHGLPPLVVSVGWIIHPTGHW